MNEKQMIIFKPSEYILNNFEFDKIYFDKIQITNNLEFPMLLNIRPSDSKLIVKEKIIKLNAGNTGKINFNIKINSKVSSMKDLYIRFFNDLIDIKYNINIVARHNKKEDKSNIFSENLISLSSNEIKKKNELDEDVKLLEENQELKHKIDNYLDRIKQLEILIESYSKIANQDNPPQTISNIDILDEENIVKLKKYIIQMKYHNFMENNIRFDEIINILQIILQENSKIINNDNSKISEISRLEELIEKFIQGIKVRLNNNDNHHNESYDLINLEAIENELDKYKAISNDLIDIKILNERLIVENHNLKNEINNLFNKSGYYRDVIKRMEEDILSFKQELDNKNEIINSNNNLLYSKDEEIEKWRSCYEHSLNNKYSNNKLLNRGNMNYIDLEKEIEDRDNQITSLKKSITSMNNIIGNLKKLIEVKRTDYKTTDLLSTNTVERLREDINIKDNIIAEICKSNENENHNIYKRNYIK